jgi:O-antigen/teichoic acid export membrane protein
MSIGNLFGTQAVIAIGQEHSKFVATIIAALLNIVGTPILIKQIGAGGACFASVFSETVVLLIYIRIVTIYDKPTLNVRTIINILISTGCMSAIIFLVKHFGMGCWFNTVIGTVAGAVTYCILMLLLDRQFRKLLISVLRKGKF